MENVHKLFQLLNTDSEPIIIMTHIDITRICDDVEKDSVKNLSLKLNLQMTRKSFSNRQQNETVKPEIS
jgi:hypothetical protein